MLHKEKKIGVGFHIHLPPKILYPIVIICIFYNKKLIQINLINSYNEQDCNKKKEKTLHSHTVF